MNRIFRRTLQVVFPLGYVGILVAVVWTFFHARGGVGFLSGVSIKTGERLLFPLAGLVAFFLTWAQVMLGANLYWLTRVYSKVATFHRRQGIVAFLFALLHPTLLLGGFGITSFVFTKFTSPQLIVYVWAGRVALFLLVLTVLAALLRRTSWLRRYWHTIHLGNYAIFGLIWIHSWKLGSDVQLTWLKWLWFFYGLTALISLLGRLERRRVLRLKALRSILPPTPANPLPPAA